MSARAKPLRLGVAGLGCVGAELVRMVTADRANAFAGKARVVAVSARNRKRNPPLDLSGFLWFDDPVELAASDDIDVLVELIGGADGPAKRAVEVAIANGKPVVTANKALLAEHGAALAALAEQRGVHIGYEAAVAGGIPIIKALREGMRGDEIESVHGILNGTCNYILTEMERTGRGFAEVLTDAQRLGYAEADPTFDVGGVDAGHKVALLAALAFRLAPAFDAVSVEGIEQIEPLDIQYAAELGYRIKLVGSARLENGVLDQRVRPTLCPLSHPLAGVGGPINAVVVDGRNRGRLTFIGAGAGGAATAASVASDILDLAAGGRRHVFAGDLACAQAPVGRVDPVGAFYLRVRLKDRTGAIAALAATLARHGVSIDSLVQKPVSDASGAPVVLTTHPVPDSVVRAAAADLSDNEMVVDGPCVMWIEDDPD